MFVLYEKDYNEDGGQFSIIKCSNVAGKLEKIKADIEYQANQFEALRLEAQLRSAERIKNHEKQIEDFLWRNKNAIREFRINSPYVEPEQPEWRCKVFNVGQPWAQETIDKKLEEIIKYVSHAHTAVFCKGRSLEEGGYNYRLLKNLLWFDRLSEPLLEIDTVADRVEYPKPPEGFVFYGPLFIEEVEEV